MSSVYKPKKNINLKTLFRSKLFLFFLLFILLIVGISLGREWWSMRSIDEDIDKLSQNVEDLKKKNEELSKQEKDYSDDYFVEKEARLRLTKQKNGEKVVVLTNDAQMMDNSNIPNSVNQTGGDINNKPCWLMWFNYFFK